MQNLQFGTRYPYWVQFPLTATKVPLKEWKAIDSGGMKTDGTSTYINLNLVLYLYQ